ncbi:hypothetical protein PR048_020086 [Dryococelus australis]|uniref:Uncharacterized protein n=1 Tax=Dryococelus australis TaxID=614101 RepID=A0ABQ9H5C1_9NEOP|nr:hypothetical protein PR048_020086 [Dryococelus australis]
MNFAIMYDILAEIALLSESLQSRRMTIAYTDKLIRRCIIFILNLKEKPGTECLEAGVASKEVKFYGATLIKNIKISAINPQQLLTSVTNNLKRRLFTTMSSNEAKSMSGSVYTNSKQEEYDTLLKELKVLERDQWPSEKPPRFGEIELERLCYTFKLTASKIKNGYHDYLEDNSRVSKQFNILFNCIKLIPCSSAECERGLSQMNLIIFPTRNRIAILHSGMLSHTSLADYRNIGQLMTRERAKHKKNK